MTWNISFPINNAAISAYVQKGTRLAFSIGVKTTLIKILLSVALIACCAAAVAQTRTTATLSPADKQIADAFEKRVKEYAKLRENVEEQMPKLSTEAKPEEIQTH